MLIASKLLPLSATRILGAGSQDAVNRPWLSRVSPIEVESRQCMGPRNLMEP